jgi:hypothetical protein
MVQKANFQKTIFECFEETSEVGLNNACIAVRRLVDS